jgi:hypothetical protein
MNIQTHEPTMNLRWLRNPRNDVDPVLQQYWIELRHPDIHYLTPPDGEWRDVPFAPS